MNINDVNVYKVEIVETLRREVTVAAVSEEDALERAEAMIAAFVEGRGTMFAIEIERDGRTFKEVVDFE